MKQNSDHAQDSYAGTKLGKGRKLPSPQSPYYGVNTSKAGLGVNYSKSSKGKQSQGK